ncbi:hypothetical protein [Hippea jasoniae]|uniref:hypothetical protein n=1 Tax=Hippea jasoniae TaxID=944479 RepID=UPI000557254F|nr:hypothetical protein [Hippea jasoniae]
MKEFYMIIGFAQILLVIFMQWQIYLKKFVLTFAFSSLLIALFLFANGIYKNSIELLILAALTLLVRAFFIPAYILKKIGTPFKARQPKAVIPTALSIVISLMLVVLAYIIYRFTLYNIVELKAGSIAIAIILQGIFLVISRNNAFIQLIGYMVMENSIFLFAGYMFYQLPFIVEGGILLDLIGIVMISAIIMKLREKSLPETVNEFEEFRG